MGLSFSKTRPLSPAKVPTDTVIPFHWINNQRLFGQLTLVMTFRFEEVLDAEKLRRALERLLEIGDWRRLGGRVRRDARGNLEYHVPEVYDEKRPGFAWSHIEFEGPISEHALASKLPSFSPSSPDRPQFFSCPTDLESLVVPSGMPKKIEDWTATDRPPLSVHVVSFKDGTLINVAWNHSLSDGMGFGALVKAWTAVLAGREEQVPPYVSADPIERLSAQTTTTKERFVLYHWAIKGPRFIGFVLTQLWRLFWNPSTEVRVVALPGAFVEKLKQDAKNDLLHAASRQDSNSNNHTVPFLSDGDVITAWMTRTMSQSLQLPSSQPVAMGNILDIRNIISDIIPPRHAYIGNAVFPVFALTQAGQLRDEAFGRTALAVRTALEQQRTREQVESHVEAYREAKTTGGIPLFGPWNMVMITMSNWYKARFFDVDFSPAVVSSGLKEEEEAKLHRLPGRPSYVHTTVYDSGKSFRNVGALIGKDAEGTWWMMLALVKGTWDAFERIARS